MLKRFYAIIGVLLLLSAMLLSSCAQSNAGGQTAAGVNGGTPGAQTSSTAQSEANASPTVQPTPATGGATYAFVRNNQLWVAQNGASATQMTSFDLSKTPTVVWLDPRWSPDDRYLAFIVSAYGLGIGGGGCGGEISTLYTTGGLYILDVQTKQLRNVQLTTANPVSAQSQPHNDAWRYIFWRDDSHLLAWYNGGNDSKIAGLYSYDLNGQTLSQAVSVKSLGVTLTMEKGLPQLLSVRYSSGQLFYQVAAHPATQQSQLIIYQQPLDQPGAAHRAILQEGGEPWCAPQAPAGSNYASPGWDVSPDAQQLVAQIISGSSGNATSTIQSMNLAANTGTKTLFTQIPAQILGQDVRLTWAVDNQIVILDGPDASMQGKLGLYSASADQPAGLSYTPNLAGIVNWRRDGSAFSLQTAPLGGSNGPVDVYLFVPGQQSVRPLLHDAHELSWG